jgi:hypothetical protein
MKTAARGVPTNPRRDEWAQHVPSRVPAKEQEKRHKRLVKLALAGKVSVTTKTRPRPQQDNAALTAAEALANADLSTEEDADHLWSHIHQHQEGVERPSIEQLRMALRIVRAVGDAVANGGKDATAWRLVGSAHRALFEQQDVLRAVILTIKGLRSLWDDGPLAHKRETLLTRARAELETLEPAYGRIADDDLTSLLSNPKLKAIGIAVELTAKCGAFGFAALPEGKKERRTKHTRARLTADTLTLRPVDFRSCRDTGITWLANLRAQARGHAAARS